MNKRRSVILWLLAVCLLCTAVLPVFAQEEKQDAFLTIATVEQFLEFAENCRLDSYSRGLTVSLECDIDLSGTEFSGIPTFSGTLDGNGHTISGLYLDGKGSVQGLFRYLQADAVVRDLTVEGCIEPSGSRSMVGGIAGSNAGRIEACTFSGSVSGADSVGGLAGRNAASGIIDGCQAEGSIQGNHFAGGIAGENLGVIRNCGNAARINTTAQQNSVEISDITLDTLTGTEAANTVTDIGGIAGSSAGVIRGCENYGDVGYPHIGYNIGGIAGSQSGYVTDCRNFGKIYGRKEAGGIVGQMEPVTTLEYEEDTLQILQDQLAAMDSLTSQTAAGAQSGTDVLNSQLGTLQDQVRDAQDALGVLTPDADDPSLPDADSIQAAQNSLNSSLSGMSETLQSLGATAESTLNTLGSNLQAMTNQMNAISATLGNASANLGGSITDVSDADTGTDLTGKVSGCENFGAVLADRNAGGITGAIALENDLDPEEDLQISGSASLNFESELRAVILDCTNSGTVTVKKQNGGGIAGWIAMGLVKQCVNTGALDGAGADYVGGIVGNSSGYIRASSAKCTVSGSDYVGGIAGKASTVTGCRSMLLLTGGERTGAVAGFAEALPVSGGQDPSIADNYYLAVGKDIGGIDGISYESCAQPLAMEAFLGLEGLPEVFSRVTVCFRFDDGTQQSVSLAPGDALDPAQIPDVPQRDGYAGTWEGLEEADLSCVVFDRTFCAVYTAREITLQSEILREDGRPVLLGQGDFLAGQTISLEALEQPPAEADPVVECWEFRLPSDGSVTQLRYLPPREYAAEDIRLMVRSGGTWREAEAQVDGSYLLFAAGAQDDALCAVYGSGSRGVIWILSGCGLAVLLAAGYLLYRSRKARKRKKRKDAAEA